MTDNFNGDKRRGSRSERSFKDQILEEMRQASEQRVARIAQEEETRRQAELAAQQAAAVRKQASEVIQLAQERARRETLLAKQKVEAARQEAQRVRQLADEQAKQEAILAAKKAEAARQEVERKRRLAEEQAQQKAAAVRREAERLARIAEEEARQEALEAARLMAEARLEAERLAELAAQEAQRQERLEAELANLARREAETRERFREEMERKRQLDQFEPQEDQQSLTEDDQRTPYPLFQNDIESMINRVDEEIMEEAQLEADRILEQVRLRDRNRREAEAEAQDLIRQNQEKVRRQKIYSLRDYDDRREISSHSSESEAGKVIDLSKTRAYQTSELISGDTSPGLSQTTTKLNFDEDLFVEEGEELAEAAPREKRAMKLFDGSNNRQKRQTTDYMAKKISRILASLIVLLLLVTGIVASAYVSSALKPLDKSATDYIQVEIPSGSGNKLIGQILEERGVIKNAHVFNYYTKFKNHTNFQSGYYNLQKSMSVDDIVKLLQAGGTPEPVLPALGKIVIPEGYTLNQIAKAVAVNGASKDKAKSPFKTEDFLALVQDPDFIAQMAAKYPNLFASLPDASLVKYQLEGYLFPATYSYYEDSTLEGIVEEMIAAMDTNLAPYYATIYERGMTVNGILTMASLVEKEGLEDADRKEIAGVFYNRLYLGMPLQSNIAILYAMDKLGEKTTLAEDAGIDTSILSPYNIYTNLGLMPGPVDSPSLNAIEATIHPAETANLFFVADVETGKVYFAETYEEHDVNVEKYINSKLAQ